MDGRFTVAYATKTTDDIEETPQLHKGMLVLAQARLIQIFGLKGGHEKERS